MLGDSTLKTLPEYFIQIVSPPSEIEGKEDVRARDAYFRLMTADPATGQIPSNIKRAELAYDQKLSRETQRLRAQGLDFKSAGPINVGGRTRAVAFDVRNEKVVLAGGVSGAVWKSLDGGLTWSKKSNPENRNSVTCIVQDTRTGKEDTWYHGTGEIVGNSPRGGGAPFRGNGIYKSTDNGETWNVIPSTQDSDPHIFNSQFQYIWNIETNPANLTEDELIIAVFGGILRSKDGGNTWQNVLGRKLFQLPDSIDLNEVKASFYTTLERSDNNIFYAVLSAETSSEEISRDAGFFYSEDGQNWNRITPPSFGITSKYKRAVIGTSPSNPDISYFMIDAEPIAIFEHDLSKLNDASRINGFDPNPRKLPEFEGDLGKLNTQGSYNMMVKVHPQNSDIVFVGGRNLYRSTDGFRTEDNITWIGGYNPEGGSGVYPSHHPDQHDLLFFPNNTSVALSASDGGLIQSDNILADSVIWKSKNEGFITSQFFTITQSQVSGDPLLVGGMQDNGTDFSTSGNKSWQGILNGDGSYAAITNDRVTWFVSFQKGQTLRLTLTRDQQITSFGRVDPGVLVSDAGSSYLFINPFVIDPINQNRMFVAGGSHLYFHPNVSQIPSGSQKAVSIGWKPVTSKAIKEATYTAVEIATNGNKLYYGTSDGRLFRLDNASNELSFENTEVTSASFPEKAYISCIAINPENENHILVVFSNYLVHSLFESKDGGRSFENVSGNMEEKADGSGNGPSVRWAEIIPKTDGLLYVIGTSVGLYSSESMQGQSTVWMKESINLIGSSVIPMMSYRATDGRLLVATHGNGVYEAAIKNFKKLNASSPTEVSSFNIESAYPNPFTNDVRIGYTIPKRGEVKIDILYANGQMINTILWADQYAGTNWIGWDGTNSSGYPLADGLYFYRIQYNNSTRTGKLILKR